MATNFGRTLPRLFLAPYRQNKSTVRWSHTGGQVIQMAYMSGIHIRNLSTAQFSKNCKATSIPLPGNVQDINAIETAQFSPQRNRDRLSEMISAQSTSTDCDSLCNLPDNSEGAESYDCTGTVSLNSAMQSNVPQPYSSKQKAPVHLNMPGGEWGRSDKYIAEEMQKALFNNNQSSHGQSSHVDKGSYAFSSMQVHGHHNRFHWWNGHQIRLMSTSSGQSGNEKPSRYDKIRKAVLEYGSTVIVFHTTISLMSLGICYLAVTSGVDLNWLSNYLPIEVPEEVSGLIIAYAIHKTLAPVRISTTLLCVPVIVRYLRAKGFLKMPSTSKYYKK